MNTIATIPDNYKPFLKLIICGNYLINGKIQISIGNYVPFLIGEGKRSPKIWLYIDNDKFKGKPIPLVRENKSLMKDLKVIKYNNITTIKINDIVILNATKIDNQNAEVDIIDLRPLGSKIYGTKNELIIGNQIFKDNTFENVDSMIGIKIV